MKSTFQWVAGVKPDKVKERKSKWANKRRSKRIPPPSPKASTSTTTTTTTQNRFSPLTVSESVNKNKNNNDNNIDTEEKPPPILIINVQEYNTLFKKISLIGSDQFTTKTNNIKSGQLYPDIWLKAKTVEGYRKAIHILQEYKYEYHTYQLKSEKSFRVVVRHLHPTTSIDLIREDLKSKGFEARNICNVKHPRTKTPLSLFFRLWARTEQSKYIQIKHPGPLYGSS